MSKKLIFGLMLTCVGVFGVQYGAHAWDSGGNWSTENCYYIAGYDGDPGMPEHCRSDSNDKIVISSNGYDTVSFNTCSECLSGYMLKEKNEWLGGCDVTYTICVPECNSAAPCPSGYRDGPATYNECNGETANNKCYVRCSNRCAGNATCPPNATCTWNTDYRPYGELYYGSSSCNASSTCPVSSFSCNGGWYKNTAGTACTQCPPADGIYTNSTRTTLARYTSAAGTTSFNNCYLPSGTTFYDVKGTFKYDSNCYYE